MPKVIKDLQAKKTLMEG
jgi:hypothetical protein